jgi:hypothetical protein
MRKIIALLGWGLWLALCTLVFAFSYSDSYFSYSPCTRIPVFAAALLGAVAMPASAFLVWRRPGPAWALVLRQAGASLLALLPAVATSFILSRASGACRLSGDDAMGVGINFLLLCALAVLTTVVLGIAAMARERRCKPQGALRH